MRFYLKREKKDGQIVITAIIENATEKQYTEIKKIGITNGIKVEGWLKKEFTADEKDELKRINTEILEKYKIVDQHDNILELA